MDTRPNTAPLEALGADSPTPALAPVARPLYWSVRRELWENRSLTIAPLVVTALVLFGLLISLFGLPQRIESLPTDDPAKLHAVVVGPFSMAPAPIMLATFLIGMFYALDALYGERRDRSILFWKSLPVSDRTTVLSKVAIPVVVLPLIAFGLSVATVFVLLFLSTAVLVVNGVSPVVVWSEVQLVQQPIVMFYGLAVHALWFAPIYAWLLLVSAWARRTPILWAVLPAFAIAAVEKIAFGSSFFGSMLEHRVTGAMAAAFAVDPGTGDINQLSHLTPLRFATSPGLWLGLGFAAMCLFAAVRLRREREPI